MFLSSHILSEVEALGDRVGILRAGRPARGVVRRVVADAHTRTLSFALLFFAVIWANAVGYRSTYPHLADRVKLVANFADNQPARILCGARHDLTTVGGYTAWRAGGQLALFAGLFGISAATRAMRADEDEGRADLVLAGAMSPTTTSSPTDDLDSPASNMKNSRPVDPSCARAVPAGSLRDVESCDPTRSVFVGKSLEQSRCGETLADRTAELHARTLSCVGECDRAEQGARVPGAGGYPCQSAPPKAP